MSHPHPTETRYRPDLDNLVPYTHPSAAWSDRHSSLALTWEAPEQPGLQRLQVLSGWAGTKITDNLLSWQIFENGRLMPLVFQSRVFRPDTVVERNTGEGIELEVTVAWPARNALAVEMAFTNTTDRPRELELRFEYPAKGVHPDWEGPFPAGHIVRVEHEPEGSWSTLFVHREHGRNFLWVENFVAGMTEGTTIELVCLADLSNRQVRLAPSGTTRIVIPMGFGLRRATAREVYGDCKAKTDAGWSAAEETERWWRILEKAPALPPKYRGQEAYERLYAHAIAGLDSLFIRGEGGYTGEKRIPWTTKDLLAIAFFWDTAFSCVGAREFGPTMAQEAIQCFVDNVGPRGSLPGTLCDTHRAGEGQAPIMAWATWSVFQTSHDKEWLEGVYSTLCGNIEFWFKYHASDRGLCQYFNAGQIADNDARFDAIQKGSGNLSLYGFESPDLNAFLVMEMNCLSELAEALGRLDEASTWRHRAAALGQLIIEATYFPEEALFYDVKTGTHVKYSGVKTPNMFLPLWAGVPLPQEEIRRVIQRHMLNGDEFFRELPFPSLSYDDPEYDPKGYWRGRIWPHVVYWMIQALWRQGYAREAELTADRLLRMMVNSSWIHENYESAKGGGIGFPEYNWSHATAIELLLERYKDRLP